MIVQPVLVVAAALFSLGIYGILVRRNAVMVLLSIELILNSVNINFIMFIFHFFMFKFIKRFK